MTERQKKYLSDILISIELVESFIKDVNTFNQYTSDMKTKSAIERQLGIIEEAGNKYLGEPNSIELSNSRMIVNFRNRLIHSYDNIDDSIVWSIVVRYLQPLKQEVIFTYIKISLHAKVFAVIGLPRVIGWKSLLYCIYTATIQKLTPTG